MTVPLPVVPVQSAGQPPSRDVAEAQVARPTPGGAGLVEAAYEAFRAEVRGALLARLRDASLVDDLVHETFLRLHVEVAGGRAPIRVRPWLHRVAANLIASRGRHARVEARERRRWFRPDQGRSAEEVVERREAAAGLRDALATLPVVEREVLLLAASGLSGPEIAAAIGRSPAATRTLLCRARRHLRQFIERTASEIDAAASV